MHKGLPEYCWSVLKATNELIMIKRGEMGYVPQNPENEPWDAENCDHLNERLGVTKRQQKAMEAGSMFGWHVPGANPEMYDENGELIRKKVDKLT